MKNLSLKIKLLISGAIALISLLIIIGIGQTIAIHKQKKENENLRNQLEDLLDQIAGANPASTTLQLNGVTVEMYE